MSLIPSPPSARISIAMATSRASGGRSREMLMLRRDPADETAAGVPPDERTLENGRQTHPANDRPSNKHYIVVSLLSIITL